MFWIALGEAQLLVLPSLLLGGCAAKALRFARAGSIEAALGPTALFPLRLRKPANIAVCLIELGLGVGLIVTAGKIGAGDPAKLIRLGTGVLFVVATAALVELRSVRPDASCGCFGELSTAPVDDRAVTRSALLALAALETARLPMLSLPQSRAQAALILTLLIVELGVLAMISPEVKEALVRLGYSEPCETRPVPEEETLATLRHSVEWSRHSAQIASDRPTDIWRELCWRYLAFPGAYPGRETEVVFAIYLQARRSVVHAVLVDSCSGAVIPWPSGPARRSWLPSWAGGAAWAGSSRRPVIVPAPRPVTTDRRLGGAAIPLPSIRLSSIRTRKL